MKNSRSIILGVVVVLGFGLYFNNSTAQEAIEKTDLSITNRTENNMKLGAISISLSVKDLKVSKEFYEKLGFKVFSGSMEKNYLIMKNEESLVGLFQGMFEGNILTFNPGWDQNGQNLDNFDDVRDIQEELKNKAVSLLSEADKNSTGPANIMLKDPDGNVILIDQHR